MRRRNYPETGQQKGGKQKERLLSAATMRMMRTMMLEVLRQDYIRTAWSKGLKERAVVIRHTLKNALIPVVTRSAGLIGRAAPSLSAACSCRSWWGAR